MFGQIVSITSQGQITIPAKIRRLLGLEVYDKAIVKAKKDKIIIEPVSDFMKLEGSLKDKAIKDKNLQEVIEIEEEAVKKAVADKYKK